MTQHIIDQNMLKNAKCQKDAEINLKKAWIIKPKNVSIN
jgi:hypothetical protein